MSVKFVKYCWFSFYQWSLGLVSVTECQLPAKWVKHVVYLSLQDVLVFLLIAKLHIWNCRRSQILPRKGHWDLRCCGVDVFLMRWIKSHFAVISNLTVCDVCVFHAAVFGEMKLFAVLWILVWLGDAVFVNFCCGVQGSPCPLVFQA